MAKKSVKVEVNNFVKGLITEASPLNFPANATVEESNFILNSDGTRDRRLGLDFEVDHKLLPVEASLDEINELSPVPYKWTNVSGESSINFLVVQIRSTINFFDLNQVNISQHNQLGSVNLLGQGFPSFVRFSFTNVDGKLVVVAGADTVAVISYTPGRFSVSTKRIRVRDVWGVEVHQDTEYERNPQYRSKTLHRTHGYNLYNQSWGLPRFNKDGNKVDPVTLYYQGSIANNGIVSNLLDGFNEALVPTPVYSGGLGLYPSNSETVWPGLQFQPVSKDTAPFERIYPELYDQVFGAEVKAAKGHFIIDLLRRGASRSEEISKNALQNVGLDFKSFATKSDYTPGGATSVCEFAGRVFFSGFNGSVVDGDARSPNLSNYLMFSQLVKSVDDITKCYQEGDPTSRESNDLIDTDGGFIRISGASNILSMVNLGSVLAVFARNGVWIVSGGSEDGFKATNYKSDRISSFGTLSRTSIVEDGAKAIYWSEDGIYAVVKDQLGGYSCENISEKTIQTFYDQIPTTSKANAIGIFDSIGKKLRWLYHLGDRFTSDSVTHELILDTSLGAFSLSTISNLANNTVEVFAPFSALPFAVANLDVTVMEGLNTVSTGVNQVVINRPVRISGLLDIKYLCFTIVNGVPFFTFGYYRNTQFRDWQRADGVGSDAYAYMVTGATTAGDSSVAKQVPYLTMHFTRTETSVGSNFTPENQSGCLISSQWDWASSSNSNKWSPQFQAYRYRKAYLATLSGGEYDNGFELVTTKNKLRGRGRAFALRLETEPYKDCKIVGWSIALNGNSVT